MEISHIVSNSIKRKNEISNDDENNLKKYKPDSDEVTITLINGSGGDGKDNLDDEEEDDKTGELFIDEDSIVVNEGESEEDKDPFQCSDEEEGKNSLNIDEDESDDDVDDDDDGSNDTEEEVESEDLENSNNTDDIVADGFLGEENEFNQDSILNGINEIIARNFDNDSGEPNDLQCKKCYKVFARKSYLRGHLCSEDLKINNKALKCKFCNKRYSHKINLRLHLKLHNNPKQWQCNICLKYLSSSSSLKVHLKTHSTTKPFKCDHCPLAFNQKVHLNDHILSHHEKVRPYSCHLCNKTYVSKSVLKKHLKKHFGIFKHECEVCSKRFFEKSALKKHMRTHSSNLSLNKLKCDEPMQCHNCLAYFHFKYKLITHFILEHGLNRLNATCIGCPLCDIQFNIIKDEPGTEVTGDSLVGDSKHSSFVSELANGVASDPCSVKSTKGIEWSSPNNMISPDYPTYLNDHKSILSKLKITPNNVHLIVSEHIKSHEYVDNNMCELCYKIFENNENLLRHLKVHDGKEKQRFQCDYCMKRFMTNAELHRHTVVVHSQLKPHECEMCGKNFSQRNNLKRHLEEVHRTNGITYECYICQKILATSHSLKRHLLIHNGPKYTCQVCSREFTRVYELNLHKKIHETDDEKVLDDLKCQYCNKLFIKRSNLRAHIANKHMEYSCLECKLLGEVVQFETKKLLLLHLKSRHKNIVSNVYMTCMICYRTLVTESDYNRHMRLHLNDNELEFDEDGKLKINPLKNKNGKNNESEVTIKRENVEVSDMEDDLEDSNDDSGEDDEDEDRDQVAKHDNDVQCLACNQTFSSNEALKQHVQKIHFPTSDLSTIENSVDITPVPKQIIQCDICFKTFARKDSLKKHTKVFHTYITPDVIQTSLIKSEPIEDVKSSGGSNMLEVILQEGSETNDDSNHSSTIIQCQICKKTFTRRDSLKKHMKRFHIIDEQVKKEFNEGEINRNMLEVILKESGLEIKSRIPCDLCYKTFTRRDSLRKHMKIFHTRRNAANLNSSNENNKDNGDSLCSGDRIPCALCDKSFTRKDSLKKHVKIFHTQNQTHDSLLDMLDVRSGDQQLPIFIDTIRCEICDKTFTRKDSLRKHNKIFHSRDSYRDKMMYNGDGEEEFDDNDKMYEDEPIVPSESFLEVVLNETSSHHQQQTNLQQQTLLQKQQTHLQKQQQIHLQQLQQTHLQQQQQIQHQQQIKQIYQQQQITQTHLHQQQLAQSHQQKLNEEKKKLDIVCKICNRNFTRNYNLKKHMRTVHKIVNDMQYYYFDSSLGAYAQGNQIDAIEDDDDEDDHFGSLSNSMLEVIIKEEQ